MKDRGQKGCIQKTNVVKKSKFPFLQSEFHGESCPGNIQATASSLLFKNILQLNKKYQQGLCRQRIASNTESSGILKCDSTANPEPWHSSELPKAYGLR